MCRMPEADPKLRISRQFLEATGFKKSASNLEKHGICFDIANELA